MKRLLILLLLLAASSLAYAHNGMEHVMGTVAKVSSSSLDVKTVAGTTRTVLVNEATKWMKGSEAITVHDVKPGDRVVVHAKPVDGKLIAAEVAVGTGVQTR
ncbi:MAG: DUF5666 domain-containing protein [Janthinobacterium lividum]